VAGVVAGKPFGFLLERLEAATLGPTVRRLLDVPALGPESGTPPWWAKTALSHACELVIVDKRLQCPTLHVVPQERMPRIETLPAGVWRRRHRIFISKGLLDAGVSRAELTALIARELSHLRAFHWRPPAAWALARAWRSPALPAPQLAGLPAEVRRELRQGWAQLLELCRMQAATTAAARAAKTSAVDLGPVTPVADWWLEHVREYEILADVCEFLEAPTTSFAKAEQLTRLVMGYAPAARTVHAARRGALEAGNALMDGLRPKAPPKDVRGKMQQRSSSLAPGTRDTAAAPALSPALFRPMVLGLLAAGRVAEMAADRDAARTLGSIEPVAAGLVRLYGSEEERHRLDRGDVRGLLDGSRAVLAARGGLLRWEMWFESLVTGPVQPPLILRLADLAAWEELGDRGRFMPWRYKTSK